MLKLFDPDRYVDPFLFNPNENNRSKLKLYDPGQSEPKTEPARRLKLYTELKATFADRPATVARGVKTFSVLVLLFAVLIISALVIAYSPGGPR